MPIFLMWCLPSGRGERCKEMRSTQGTSIPRSIVVALKRGKGIGP